MVTTQVKKSCVLLRFCVIKCEKPHWKKRGKPGENAFYREFSTLKNACTNQGIMGVGVIIREDHTYITHTYITFFGS